MLCVFFAGVSQSSFGSLCMFFTGVSHRILVSLGRVYAKVPITPGNPISIVDDTGASSAHEGHDGDSNFVLHIVDSAHGGHG